MVPTLYVSYFWEHIVCNLDQLEPPILLFVFYVNLDSGGIDLNLDYVC